MKNKFIFPTLIILLLLTVFSSGCNKEVEQLAVGTLAGEDIITEKGIDKYSLWVKIMQRASTTGKQGDQQSDESSEILIKGEGMTIGEATTEIMGRLPRAIFVAQINATIYGARLAQEKILSNLESAFSRPDGRPNNLVFITKGDASRILQLQPSTMPTLTMQIKDQTERALTNGLSCGVTVTEFSEWMLSPDRDALMPEIEQVSPVKGETVPPSILIQGFGFFRDDKLMGWLDKDESLGYLLITRKLSDVTIPMTLTLDGKSLVYTLVGSNNKIEYKLNEGKPSFKIKIQAVGVITENENNNLNLTPEQIQPLEKIIAETIHTYPMLTIAKAKEYDADFLGLMENFHRYSPSAWHEIAPNWREVFRKADVEVEVSAKILGRGFVTKTWNVKKE